MSFQKNRNINFIFAAVVSVSLLGAEVRAETEPSSSPSKPSGFNFSTKDGKSTLKVNLFGQGMAQYFFQDSGSKSLAAKIAAARVTLSGQAASSKASYLGTFDFAGYGGDGTPTFVDLYFGYDFFEALKVRAGLFKVPYSRLFQTADEDTAFAAFHTNLNKFSLGRDVGFNVYGFLLKDHLEYNLFAFSGKAGSFTQANNDDNLEWNTGARLNAHLLGKSQYEDINWERETCATFGIAGAFDPKTTFSQASTTAADEKILRATSDLLFQYKSWTFMSAYHLIHNVSKKRSTNGAEGLMSVFVIPNSLLFALKAAGNMPRGTGGHGDGPLNTYELGGALTHFFHGRHLKLVGDYSAEFRESLLTTKTLVDHRIRMLLQVWL